MNRPAGGNGGGIARGVGSAAAKGTFLIALAVVVGIVLLQQVDNGKTTSGASPTTHPRTTTTTRHVASTSTTRPTTPATGAVKAPAQLSVIVLNGGAPSGRANTMRTKLLQKGYTNQPAATNWTGHHQTGNSVFCRSGLTREATRLASAVGPGTVTRSFPSPPPTNAPSSVDCVVVVGA